MCLYSVKVEVHMDGVTEKVPLSETDGEVDTPEPTPGTSQDSLETGGHTFTVGQLAYTRSGDKANSANVGKFLSNNLLKLPCREKTPNGALKTSQELKQ